MNGERVDIWGDGSDDERSVPAPTYYEDVPPEAPDTLDRPSQEIEETRNDGGISDAERIVRVWVEDGRLVKVRVSPNWHVKLTRRRGVTLGQVFSAVLQMAHVGVAQPREVERPTVELTRQFKASLPEMTEETLARVQEHSALLHARFEAEKRRRAAAVRPQPPATVGRAKGVTVRLNGYGHATAVEFDPQWLDTAHAGQISDGVMRASQDAYDRYVPEPDDDDLSRAMAREFSYIRQVMYTMLTPKERR